MASQETPTAQPNAFVSAGKVIAIDSKTKDARRRITEKLSLALQTRHVCVLVGTGSSYDLKAPRIRDMTLSALLDLVVANDQSLSQPEVDAIYQLVGQTEHFDLEFLLGELSTAIKFSLSSYARLSDNQIDAEALKLIRAKLNHSLAHACDLAPRADQNDAELSAHKRFLVGLLSTRRADLSRIRVFTTNYDLLIEKSLDSLGIDYIDGFVGTINRTLKMDVYNREMFGSNMAIGDRRPRRVSDFLYLYKLHGSVNWRARTFTGEDADRVVQIANYATTELHDLALIYPTPQKESDTLGYPYADLLRAFSDALAESDTALLTVGYGFGDKHVNRIIAQNLSGNPTLAVMIVEPYNLLAQVDDNFVVSRQSNAGVFVANESHARVSAISGSDCVFSRFSETFFAASGPDQRPTDPARTPA